MACTEEKPNFKHYCRICKKGFMCGRALGGHMRAHGIGDESGNLEDYDQASDWEDKHGSSTRMYKLRTNPNRLKSCRVCENCGKEFLSWKSFLEHGKCSSEDVESDGGGGGGGRRSCQQWSKRKRSLRTKVGSFSSTNYPSSEDEDLLLAKCLVDLANARFEVEPEESSASASREEERRYTAVTFLAPMGPTNKNNNNIASNNNKGLFECKACKKVFNSHQALGGHRASHKKVKGCYAAKQDQMDNDSSMADEDVIITNEEFFIPSKSTSSSRRKSKVHECTICHRIFSTGQALGGHKRCHWMTSNSSPEAAKIQLNHHHDQVDQVHHIPTLNDKSEGLDLNLNLPAQDHHGNKRDPQNPWVFTDIRLQIWSNGDTKPKDESNPSHHDNNESNQIKTQNDVVSNVDAHKMVEDEADSKVKLEKLSELKGINISGSSSPWLQVGIGNSSTDVVTGGP